MALFTLIIFWICLLVGAYSQSFNCPVLPSHTPTNVTDLHPNDIKVVLAMGDSITAAFGLHGASAGFVEARGLSHSIGGDENATTMPNFLRYFNPNLQGPSLGKHFAELCSGSVCPPDQYRPAEDVLNGAQSGAVVGNLIIHELDYLLKTMHANPNIDFQNDWKLLTIFIGGNDLCEACYQILQDPEEFGEQLDLVLQGIQANIPKVFVQIIEIFNISQVYDLSLKSPRCSDIHRTFAFECECVFDKNATQTRQLIDVYSQLYNQQSRTLAAKYQALNDPDFTVVTQPYGRNTALKNFPVDILSDLDCFHPSLMGHQAMAIALWNNMITPAAQKKTYLDLSDSPICPDADTLLYVN